MTGSDASRTYLSGAVVSAPLAEQPQVRPGTSTGASKQAEREGRARDALDLPP